MGIKKEYWVKNLGSLGGIISKFLSIICWLSACPGKMGPFTWVPADVRQAALKKEASGKCCHFNCSTRMNCDSIAVPISDSKSEQ